MAKGHVSTSQFINKFLKLGAKKVNQAQILIGYGLAKAGFLLTLMVSHVETVHNGIRSNYLMGQENSSSE